MPDIHINTECLLVGFLASVTQHLQQLLLPKSEELSAW